MSPKTSRPCLPDPNIDVSTVSSPAAIAAKLLVRIVDLHKRFGPVEVLKGVNLEIAAGEKLAMIGPSGSGKTTLLRCVDSLEMPSSGEVYIDGEPIGLRPVMARGQSEERPRASPRMRAGSGDGVPALQPLPAPERRWATSSIGALKVACAARSRARGGGPKPRLLLAGVGHGSRRDTNSFRSACPAASSSGLPSPARWRCDPS